MKFDGIIDGWFLLMAIVVPVSIAGTSLLYFPLLGLYVLFGFWTFRRWPPQWGGVEKAFLIFWSISFLSAICGMDPWLSRIRLGKDLYFLILVLLGAYLAQKNQNSKLLKTCMVVTII